MDQFLAKLATTLAAVIIGAIAKAAFNWIGWDITPEQILTWQTGLATFLAAVFVAVVHFVSAKVPWLGWLILQPIRPLFFWKKDREIILDAVNQKHGYGATSGGDEAIRVRRLLS